MAKATLNGTLLAESKETPLVEGYRYFPAESVQMEMLKPSAHTSVCPWKGVASYYDVVVDGKVAKNAAWSYRQPKDAAQHIKGLIAFWNPVKVEP